MKIALLGYGRMGKTVEALAQGRGHSVVLKISSSNIADLAVADAGAVDVAIDFSLEEIAPNLIKTCIEKGIPVVSGTTGWLDKLSEVESLCKARQGAFLYASNFSIGVNLFFSLNRKLAKLMKGQTQYTPSLEEIHHIHKKDAPSGTAISLADIIIQEDSRYNDWNLTDNTTNQLYISAKRIEEVPGTHEISYQSDIDTISIKHEAHSRDGFALGAIIAAEWINGKTGIFTMNDVLEIKE